MSTSEARREQQAAYERSPQGRAKNARYKQTAKGQAVAERGKPRRAVRNKMRYWTDDAYRAKVLARTAVGNAIKLGKMARGTCETCGQRAEAHHEDYTKPLEVRWFCRAHHREAHRDTGVVLT